MSPPGHAKSRPGEEAASSKKTNLVDGSADDDETAALEAARYLAANGVPIFLADPARSGSGAWLPAGGTGRTGYLLPSGWQKQQADVAVLDRYRSGMAVCAVMGHGLDLLDVDPRNGGEDSHRKLLEAGNWPREYARASTPSEGWHAFVAPLGVRSKDGVMPGLDVKAGVGGRGHGFAFIAPTRKRSKVTGEIARYRWITPPGVESC